MVERSERKRGYWIESVAQKLRQHRRRGLIDLTYFSEGRGRWWCRCLRTFDSDSDSNGDSDGDSDSDDDGDGDGNGDGDGDGDDDDDDNAAELDEPNIRYPVRSRIHSFVFLCPLSAFPSLAFSFSILLFVSVFHTTLFFSLQFFSTPL